MTGSYISFAREREYRKIVFQYGLMLLASLVAGWLLPRLLSDALWERALASISAHFTPSLKGGKVLFHTVFSFFWPTFLCIITVAVFSFSSLNCLITDGVLVYLGMRTGCTVSMLYSLFRTTASLSYRPSLLLLFVFVLFKLVLLFIFTSYAVRMAQYAYRLRTYSEEGRTLFHPRTVGALILHFSLCSFVTFLLHFLYVCTIDFVSK